MRAIFTLACLALTAVAAPRRHKRDVLVVVETETDIVWVTDVETVTAEAAAPTPIYAQQDMTVTTYAAPPPMAYTVVSSPTSTTRDVLPTTTTTSSIAPPVAYTTVIVVPPPVETSSELTSTPTLPTSSVTSTSTSISSTTSEAVQSPSSTSSIILGPPTTTPAIVRPPPIVSTTQATPSTTDSSGKPTDYSQLVVAHHNLHRRNHSAPDIAWDNNLAVAAATIASSCSYGHNTDIDKDIIGGYGQNIAAGVGADNISLIITELFYNGEVNWYNGLYGQANPDMSNFESWGHFSQIVWHDTSKVGCATQHCDTLANVASNVPPYFTVCNYQTPGNVGGEYATEVGRSLNLPTVHWDYFL